MSKNLRAITAKVLGLDEKKVTASLKRDKTEEWDSFNHLMLVSEIEKQFGIALSTKEIESIKTYADLEALLGQHGKH